MDRTLSSEVFCPGNYNGEKYGKSETSAWEGEECFADTGQRQNKSLKESSIEIADWKHFHFSFWKPIAYWSANNLIRPSPSAHTIECGCCCTLVQRGGKWEFFSGPISESFSFNIA